MEFPKELKYTESHEWVRVEGPRAFVGITDYAQDSLGDIVYIELPEVGRAVSMDEEITTIESVKAAEPIYSPLTGTIGSVNADLNDSPEQINSAPYGAHIFTVDFTNPEELSGFLDAEAYRLFVEREQAEKG